jgi:hypothetical protein
MLKLMDAGLVATQKVYSDPRDLYIPTQAAIKVLEDSSYPFAIALAKDRMFSNYLHDRGLVDLRIFFEETGIGIWIPERVIRSVKPRGSSPDALLMISDQVCAIEYERTEKEPSRYKKIFDRYNFSDKYAKVLYILPTEKRIETLKKKLGYIWKKFYFASEELLRLEKRDAVFYSSNDGLPLMDLRENSLTGDLADLTREEITAVVESETPDAWQNRKPFVAFTGGGKRKNEDGFNDGSSGSDSGCNPEICPEENRDGYDDEDEGR